MKCCSLWVVSWTEVSWTFSSLCDNSHTTRNRKTNKNQEIGIWNGYIGIPKVWSLSFLSFLINEYFWQLSCSELGKCWWKTNHIGKHLPLGEILLVFSFRLSWFLSGTWSTTDCCKFWENFWYFIVKGFLMFSVFFFEVLGFKKQKVKM